MRNRRHIYQRAVPALDELTLFASALRGLRSPQRALDLGESLQTRLRTTQNQRMDVVSAFVGIHRL